MLRTGFPRSIDLSAYTVNGLHNWRSEKRGIVEDAHWLGTCIGQRIRGAWLRVSYGT